MNLSQLDKALFTAFENGEYFLETNKGNFVWVKSEETIYPFNGSIREYFKRVTKRVGHSLGNQTISTYCGNNVRISELSYSPDLKVK